VDFYGFCESCGTTQIYGIDVKEWNISLDPFEFLMDFSGSSMYFGGPNEGFLVLLDLF
jgi:hypothetical protein